MTTTDEARVTDEEIASRVDASRMIVEIRGQQNLGPRGLPLALDAYVIVALADRLASKDNLIRELHELGRQDGERIVALESRLAARDAEVEFYRDSLEAARRNARDSIDARDAEVAKLRETLEMHEEQITNLVSTNAVEITRLRSERAEMVALMEATGDYQATDFCDGAEGDEPMSDECYDEKPCWSHRAAALLAKLRTP